MSPLAPMVRALRGLGGAWHRVTGEHRRVSLASVDGVSLVVLPEVMNPARFRSGALLGRAVRDQGVAGRVLDLGTGSGVGAVFAARQGASVIATDTSAQALRCAGINRLLHDLEARISLRQGDLFAPVAGERFDWVLFNPPFYLGAPETPWQMAWRGEGVAERFAAGLSGALLPGGRALLALSDEGIGPALRRDLADRGHRLTEVARDRRAGELLTVSLVEPR